MTTVTTDISSLDQVMRRSAAAFRGACHGERIPLASVELLWKTLTPRRWDLVRAMAGQSAMAHRAAARFVGRDVKITHGDVQALLQADVLEKDEAGRIVFL